MYHLTSLFKYENAILPWPTLEAGQTIPKAQRSKFNTSGRGSVGLGFVVALTQVLMGLAGGYVEPSRAAWTAYPNEDERSGPRPLLIAGNHNFWAITDLDKAHLLAIAGIFDAHASTGVRSGEHQEFLSRWTQFVRA